jgi:hypothetical protein
MIGLESEMTKIGKDEITLPVNETALANAERVYTNVTVIITSCNHVHVVIAA